MTDLERGEFWRKLGYDAAKAWRAVVEDEPEEVPYICEGCYRPAYHFDSEGVSLCDDCYDDLADEVDVVRSPAEGFLGGEPMDDDDLMHRLNRGDP